MELEDLPLTLERCGLCCLDLFGVAGACTALEFLDSRLCSLGSRPELLGSCRSTLQLLGKLARCLGRVPFLLLDLGAQQF